MTSHSVVSEYMECIKQIIMIFSYYTHKIRKLKYIMHANNNKILENIKHILHLHYYPTRNEYILE